MIEKHQMIADFEQLIYSPAMLRRAWNECIDRFRLLINGGWTNKAVLDLIEYIRQSNYADKFFPGTSLGTLLISKPRNGKLNYQQTLSISVDNLTHKIKLEYSDWDSIDKREDIDKATLWNAECNDEQLKEKFEEFITWNKNWS